MYCARGGAGARVAVAAGCGVSVLEMVVEVGGGLVDVGAGLAALHEEIKNANRKKIKSNERFNMLRIVNENPPAVLREGLMN